jgi:hypothetical protein
MTEPEPVPLPLPSDRAVIVNAECGDDRCAAGAVTEAGYRQPCALTQTAGGGFRHCARLVLRLELRKW